MQRITGPLRLYYDDYEGSGPKRNIHRSSKGYLIANIPRPPQKIIVLTIILILSTRICSVYKTGEIEIVKIELHITILYTEGHTFQTVSVS